MSEPNYQDPLFDLQYKEKMDPQYLLNLQQLRCLQSSGTVFFAENVEMLLRMIPSASKIMIARRHNEWNPIIEDFDYSWAGPIRLGTQKKPLMAKKGYTSNRYPVPYVEDEDGEKKIDWKYIISCIAGGVIITGSYFLYDYAPTSAMCFIIVGVMIPTVYSLYGGRL